MATRTTAQGDRYEVRNRYEARGSAANVAAFAGSRYPTRFIGCVGDDPGAHVLREELAGHGVQVRLQVRKAGDVVYSGSSGLRGGLATGMVVVLIDKHGERTMFPSRGASPHLTPIDDSWLDDLEILHVTGYSFECEPTVGAVLDAVRRHHRNGGLVSFDVSSTGLIQHYGVAAFLELMVLCRPDIISANEDECRLLELADAGMPGPVLSRFPGAYLLARRGAEPTTVIQNGEAVASVAARRVRRVRDLTGAGDAFNAGFLTAYLQNGGDVVRSCRAGHNLSARVLQSAGATEVP